MTSYRLRVEVRDLPGALADLTDALASAGCNVLRVDVHGVDGRTAVDELSVVAPDATTAEDLRVLVAERGAVPLLVTPLERDADGDPVTSALTAAADIAATPSGPDRIRRLEEALARQLDARTAWLLPAPSGSEPLFGRAVATVPTVVTLPTAGGTGRDADVTLALVPHGDTLGVALRWGRWSFTASEIARASGFMRLGASVAPLPTTPAEPPSAALAPTRAGELLAVRPLSPGDAVHLLDLDLRLSDRTRRLRFNASRGLPTGSELRRTIPPLAADRLAVGAWSDEGLVGEARYVRLDEDPVTAELAIVVADAYQRRGVGELLVAELAARATARGIRRFVAQSAPHNDAVRRVLSRLSASTITRIAHGTVEQMVDLADLAASRPEQPVAPGSPAP